MRNKLFPIWHWSHFSVSLLVIVCSGVASFQSFAQETDERNVEFCIYLLNDTSGLYNELQSMGGIEYASDLKGSDSTAEQASVVVGPTENISDKVLTYVAPRLKYMKDGELIPLEIHHGVRSDFYEYEGPMPIELYEEVNEHGSVQLKHAGSFDIPIAQEQVLVVLAGISKGEYRSLTIEVGDMIKAGSSIEDSRIYNITNIQLAIRAGSLTKILEPNENTALNSSELDSNYLPVRLGIRINDKWRRRYSSSLFMTDKTAKVFLIYQPRDLESSLDIVSVRL